MPSLLGKVIKLQGQDVEKLSIKILVRPGTSDKGWTMRSYGRFWYRGQVMISQSKYLREEILNKFYCSRFVVHPCGTKMYHDLCHCITRVG